MSGIIPAVHGEMMTRLQPTDVRVRKASGGSMVDHDGRLKLRGFRICLYGRPTGMENNPAEESFGSNELFAEELQFRKSMLYRL